VHIGNINGNREAPVEEIKAVKGMNEKLAALVKENL
jgi:excinuclease UvrABC nuclease subunit